MKRKLALVLLLGCVALVGWLAMDWVRAGGCDDVSRNALHLMSDVVVQVEQYRARHDEYPVAATNEQLRTYPGFESFHGGPFTTALCYTSDGAHYTLRFDPGYLGLTIAPVLIELKDGHLNRVPTCVWPPRLVAFDRRVKRGLLEHGGSQSN